MPKTACTPTPHVAGHTSLCWFVQTNLHFAEALTQEGVTALGSYLARRQRQLDSQSPVIEIGAADGRLAYLLQQT